jgi:hypothetical protein
MELVEAMLIAVEARCNVATLVILPLDHVVFDISNTSILPVDGLLR